MSEEKVMIGIPSHDRRIDYGIVPALTEAGLPVKVNFCAKSVLTSNFNELMRQALDPADGATHFLLWHSDIVPTDTGWLLKMVGIMREHKLDALCPVVPIKEDSGRTSTAYQRADGSVECLNVSDLKDLPATFTTADLRAKYGDCVLLINSGLLLIRLKNLDPVKCHFTMLDKFVKGADGKWEVGSFTEDWVFSVMMHKAGMSYAATSDIHLTHFGSKGWSI